MTTRYWDPVEYRWVDCTVCWNGTMYRQNERLHSLLGSGWTIRRNHLMQSAHARDAFPTAKDVAKANALPADMGWRTPRTDAA